MPSSPWLPAERLSSWNLDVSRRISPSDGGAFIPGALPKVTWHTTEGLGVDLMADVLLNKNACPHFLIGRTAKGEPMKVIQFIPLGRAARALEHPFATPATNAAGCLQIEVCGFARESIVWDAEFYMGLASLACLIEHHVPVKPPRKIVETFTATANRQAKRIAPSLFLRATGHVGHEHVPNNSHWDPGMMQVRAKLFPAMKKADH